MNTSFLIYKDRCNCKAYETRGWLGQSVDSQQETEKPLYSRSVESALEVSSFNKIARCSHLSTQQKGSQSRPYRCSFACPVLQGNTASGLSFLHGDLHLSVMTLPQIDMINQRSVYLRLFVFQCLMRFWRCPHQQQAYKSSFQVGHFCTQLILFDDTYWLHFQRSPYYDLVPKLWIHNLFRDCSQFSLLIVIILLPFFLFS